MTESDKAPKVFLVVSNAENGQILVYDSVSQTVVNDFPKDAIYRENNLEMTYQELLDKIEKHKIYSENYASNDGSKANNTQHEANAPKTESLVSSLLKNEIFKKLSVINSPEYVSPVKTNEEGEDREDRETSASSTDKAHHHKSNSVTRTYSSSSAKNYYFDKSELKKQIEKFQDRKYSEDFFKTHKRGVFFYRRKIPKEELLSFSDRKINDSILKSVPNKLKKNAVELFEYLLMYAGLIRTRKSKGTIMNSIFEILYKKPALRNEFYFQLQKQTTKCPDIEYLRCFWQVFFVVASHIPSSREDELYLKGYIASRVEYRDHDDYLDSFLKPLTYLRFDSTCYNSRNIYRMEPPSQSRIESFVNDTSQFYRVSNISISESLWIQNSSYLRKKLNLKGLHKPDLKIPNILKVLTERILEKGAKTTEGVFRIPGNGRVYPNALSRMDKHFDYYLDLEIFDLCSLLKRYFEQLPIRLFPESIISDFMTLTDEPSPENDDKILSKMATAHKIVLLYLAGFLKDIASAQESTRMGAPNLAMVFAPNLFQDWSNSERTILVNRRLCSFLERIMERDVSRVYPVS